MMILSCYRLTPPSRSHTPRMPHHNAELAPATSLYWSKAPVWGHLPDKPMRGHSATLVDHLIWQIGGCDHNGVCFGDILCFNAGAPALCALPHRQ